MGIRTCNCRTYILMCHTKLLRRNENVIPKIEHKLGSVCHGQPQLLVVSVSSLFDSYILKPHELLYGGLQISSRGTPAKLNTEKPFPILSQNLATNPYKLEWAIGTSTCK